MSDRGLICSETKLGNELNLCRPRDTVAIARHIEPHANLGNVIDRT